ncbi:hypothetical protein [Streptomyces cellulosae]|uniref:hypothetical protein n=1 Tax=Streptomyces cellulosae TaxID=1968 RepID=UPI00131D1FA4|nr:hypothetical protein [Streptomyces cellulosae]
MRALSRAGRSQGLPEVEAVAGYLDERGTVRGSPVGVRALFLMPGYGGRRQLPADARAAGGERAVMPAGLRARAATRARRLFVDGPLDESRVLPNGPGGPGPAAPHVRRVGPAAPERVRSRATRPGLRLKGPAAGRRLTGLSAGFRLTGLSAGLRLKGTSAGLRLKDTSADLRLKAPRSVYERWRA